MSHTAVLREINTGHSFSALESRFGLTKIYVVEMRQPGRPNPYTDSTKTPRLLGALDAGRPKLLTEKQRRDNFGQTDEKHVSIYCNPPAGFTLTQDQYAVINYFSKTEVTYGRIKSAEKLLNQRIALIVETLTNFPFTLAQAGIVL